MIGQCDCCGKEAELTNLIAYGIETAACAKCCGHDEDEEADEYERNVPTGPLTRTVVADLRASAEARRAALKLKS